MQLQRTARAELSPARVPALHTRGVDIEAGNALVKAIAPLARATARPGADAALGGFGGFFAFMNWNAISMVASPRESFCSASA